MDAAKEYSLAREAMSRAAEAAKKRNSLLYGAPLRVDEEARDDVLGVEDVLTQVARDVSALESSRIPRKSAIDTISKFDDSQWEEMSTQLIELAEASATVAFDDSFDPKVLAEHERSIPEEFDDSLVDTSDECPTSPILMTQGKRNAICAKEKPSVKAKLEDVMIGCDSNDTKDSFIGFRTASNKEINISNESLKRIEDIFGDIFENESQFDTDTNKKAKADCDFPGFVTASNKPIPVSDTALKKYTNYVDPKLFTSSAKDSKDDIEFPKPFESPSVKESSILPKFEGFTTASNKKIEVSKEALVKAKRIFTDVEFQKDIEGYESRKDVQNETDNFEGFVTASNKKIKVSKEALVKAKRIFTDGELQKDFESTKDAQNETDNFEGFVTASNKKIEVSKKALAKAKHIFNNENLQNDLDPLYESSKSSTNNVKFEGFTTASNKKIEVSKESLAKAKSLFNDIDFQSDLQPIAKEAFKPPEVNIDLKDSASNFEGFRTASNKKIEISKEALTKARHIFTDVDFKSCGPSKSTSNDTSYHEGFVTASNKKIEVSKKALAKARTIFTEEKFESSDTSKSTADNMMFEGFVTASNKKIEVSKEALTKAKRLFNDVAFENDFKSPTKQPSLTIEDTRTGEVKFEGFVTASNKKIEVSKEALARVKHMLADGELHYLESNTIPDNVEPELSFTGFVTASNKKVKVSKEALQKAQNLFQCETVTNSSNKAAPESDFPGFVTASNKKIVISKKALEKAKNIFSEPTDSADKSNLVETVVPNTKNTSNNKEINASEKAILETKNIFNDLSEFDEIEIGGTGARKSTHEANSIGNDKSLDFALSNEIEPPSSPILQTKKRKIFKAPFKTDMSVKCDTTEPKKRKIERTTTTKTQKNITTVELSLGNLLQRKCERGSRTVTLKEMFQHRAERNNIRDDQILDITPQNCPDFEFLDQRCDVLNRNKITVPEIADLFINHSDIDRKLIPDGWILNHTKWIIWKLASYERLFRNRFSDLPILKASNVLEQLKYRYDKELYGACRPALRKILEKDEVAAKRMVLCVSNIISINKAIVVDENITSNLASAQYEIELTDGWYGVTASLDPILCEAISSGKIAIGTKLMIHGAELLNCEQGVAPLEDTSFVRLKISANSCRRCAPWLKLGICKSIGPMTLKLENCRPGGGPISILQMIVLTVYPMLYMTKSASGSITMRSEKLQQMHNAKQESELQAQIERLYSEVEAEYHRENAKSKKTSFGMMPSKKLSNLSPDELADLLEASPDPQDFLNNLSKSQRNNIEQIVLEKRERIRQEIDTRVKNLMAEQDVQKQKAVKVLKLRILTAGVKSHCTFALLTIWRPNDGIIEELKENLCFNATNLSPTGMKRGELHLSAGNKSTFNRAPSSDLKLLPYYKKKCTSFDAIYEDSFAPPFNEVDIVGLIVKIEPAAFDASKNRNNLQTVYLANERKKCVAVVFWGGIGKSGFEKAIERGKCVACQNLQNRSRALAKRVRQLHVTELSHVTSRPNKKYIESAVRELESRIGPNIDEYIQECLEELDRVLLNDTPKKEFSNIRENYPSKRIRLQSNCTKSELDDELSLTGFDFESTFVDTTADCSEICKENSESRIISSVPKRLNISTILAESGNSPCLQSPSLVEMKINKLKMYGDPPPLSPIVLKHSKKLNMSFANPLANSSFECNANTSVSTPKKNVVMRETDEDLPAASPPLSFE